MVEKISLCRIVYLCPVMTAFLIFAASICGADERRIPQGVGEDLKSTYNSGNGEDAGPLLKHRVLQRYGQHALHRDQQGRRRHLSYAGEHSHLCGRAGPCRGSGDRGSRQL